MFWKIVGFPQSIKVQSRMNGIKPWSLSCFLCDSFKKIQQKIQ